MYNWTVCYLSSELYETLTFCICCSTFVNSSSVHLVNFASLYLYSVLNSTLKKANNCEYSAIRLLVYLTLHWTLNTNTDIVLTVQTSDKNNNPDVTIHVNMFHIYFRVLTMGRPGLIISYVTRLPLFANWQLSISVNCIIKVNWNNIQNRTYLLTLGITLPNEY